MRKRYVRAPIFVISLLLAFEPMAFAAKGVALVPILDGSNDQTSQELVSSFTNALRARGVDVVDRSKVDDILNYSRISLQNAGAAHEEAETLLEDAKAKYFSMEFDEAGALAKKAIELLTARDISLCGAMLRDAHVVSALIFASERKRKNDAVLHFKAAIGIDPSFELIEKDFSPSVVRLFRAAREDVLSKKAQSLKISTEPKVGEIFVNGIFKGVSPLQLDALPAGIYKVTAKANRYATETKEVELASVDPSYLAAAPNILSIAFDLKWADAKNLAPAAIEESKEVVKEGVRIADILKVEKVVTIDADVASDMSGAAHIRMIDGTYSAGHNPIEVVWDTSRKDLADELSNAADILVEQISTNVALDPKGYLDPDGVGDVHLLGAKKRSMSNAAFWGIAGGIVAAIAGGVTAALLSGGGAGESTGSVNVRFK